MKNCFKVLKRDLGALIKNPVAILIVAGLCILPSFYAWVNIAAVWNPYGNTSDVCVAVVNSDTGATLDGKEINLGNDVVDKLKGNDKIGWRFVDEQEAQNGLLSGKYYAEIEIPKDFSEDLASVTSDNPVKPDIIYKVNTKESPVAGKITEVAQSNLVNEISSSFIESVSETMFSKVNGYGDNLNSQRDNILKIKSAIIYLNNNMNSIEDALKNINSNSNSLNTTLGLLKGEIPTISQGINSLSNININTQDFVSSAKSSVDTSYNTLKTNYTTIQSEIGSVNGLLDNLKNLVSNNGNSEDKLNTINEAINKITTINTLINANISFLEGFNNSKLDSAINDLKTLQNFLDTQKTALENAKNIIGSGQELSNTVINTLIDNGNSAKTQINNIVNTVNNVTMPELNNIGNKILSATNDATKIIGTSKGLIGQINTILNTATTGTNMASNMSSELISKLNEYKEPIANLATQLEKVNDNDLSQIVSILQSNPKVVGSFASSPFNIDEQVLYAVPNYGSAMAPIYTVLALWVGALLLTSLLSTKSKDFEGSEKISVRQKHFGKMMFFVILGALQGLIVCLGDKYILGVYTVNFPLMILFSVLSAVTFTIIVFTFVSVFGNIGKAICIVLMVLQLAGSGGTYPIQVVPKIFQILQPFFPFTYAVGGFREAIAGPLLSSVIKDIEILVIMAIIFILIGFFLKNLLNKKVEKFEEEFNKSGVGE